MSNIPPLPPPRPQQIPVQLQQNVRQTDVDPEHASKIAKERLSQRIGASTIIYLIITLLIIGSIITMGIILS